MASNVTPITEQDLEVVDQFLQEMKRQASTYHDQGNAVMLGIIHNIVKDVSRATVRLHARYERESLASVSRDHKELRKSQRNGSTSA